MKTTWIICTARTRLLLFEMLPINIHRVNVEYLYKSFEKTCIVLIYLLLIFTLTLYLT